MLKSQGRLVRKKMLLAKVLIDMNDSYFQYCSEKQKKERDKKKTNKIYSQLKEVRDEFLENMPFKSDSQFDSLDGSK